MLSRKERPPLVECDIRIKGRPNLLILINSSLYQLAWSEKQN